MKKLVAVLLVLAMMVAATAAFAEAVNSKTAGDIAGTGTVVVKGGDVGEGIVITILKADEIEEAIGKLEGAIVDEKKLPDDVEELVPDEFKDGELGDHLKEMFALIATGEIGDIQSYTVGLVLDTPYEKDAELLVLFGTPEGWIAKTATVVDGEVTVELLREDLEKMVNKGQIAVLVFNK